MPCKQKSIWILSLALSALLMMSSEARAGESESQIYDGTTIVQSMPSGVKLLKVLSSQNGYTCGLKASLTLGAEEWLIKSEQQRTLSAYYSEIYFVLSTPYLQKTLVGTVSCEDSAIHDTSLMGLINFATLGFSESLCRSWQENEYAYSHAARVLIFGKKRPVREQAAIFATKKCGYIKNMSLPECQNPAVPTSADDPEITLHIVDQTGSSCGVSTVITN